MKSVKEKNIYCATGGDQRFALLMISFGFSMSKLSISLDSHMAEHDL